MTGQETNKPLMQDLQGLFSECDIDNNGSLTRDEFSKLCIKIGLNEATAAKTFDRLDADKDERITFEEFAAGFNKYQQQSKPTTTQRSTRVSLGNKPAAGKLISSSSASPTSISASTSTVIAGPRGRKSASPTTTATILTPQTSSSSSGNESGNQISLSNQSNQLSHSSSWHSSNNNNNNQDTQEAARSSNKLITTRLNSSLNVNNDEIVYESGELDDRSVSFGEYSGQWTGNYDNLSSAASLNQLKSMQELMESVQKLQNENQMLAQVMLKDRKERDEYISQLGEEFDSQVRQVEQKYKWKARDEVESERRKYREMIQVELDKLQSHYATLENMTNTIKARGKTKKGNSSNLRKKGRRRGRNESCDDDGYDYYDDDDDDDDDDGNNGSIGAGNDDDGSHKLEKSLLDTKSEVAAIKEEMKRLKLHYETKLKNANFKNIETEKECDNIKQQLNYIKDSNKRLQDTSDALTIYINESVDQQQKQLKQTNNDDNMFDENKLSFGSRRGSILSEYLGDIIDQTGDKQNQVQQVTVPNQEELNEEVDINCKKKKKERVSDDDDDDDIKEERRKTSVENKGSNNNSLVRQVTRSLFSSSKSSSILDDKHLSKSVVNSNKGSEQVNITNDNKISIHEQETNDDIVVEKADGEVVARFHVILVGDSFVGKSSFAARFMGGQFKQGLLSNCSIDFNTNSFKVDGINYGVDLWDTAGQERFRSITASYFRKADGIILMYDVSEKRSYLNVRNWMSTIADSASQNVVVLLVGNKIDLRTNDNMSTCVPSDEGKRLAAEYDILFLETSVKTGLNLMSSIGKLIKLIAKKKVAADDDDDKIKLGDKSNTFAACMPKNC